MASLHTAGEWRVDATEDGQRYGAIVSDSEPRDEGYGGKLIAESVRENDRPLLAAAPKLLAACWAALDEDSGLACADQLRAAIVAAGEEPPR